MFIILDAIDESPNSTGTPSPRERVFEFVEWLLNFQCSNFSVCVTSRPESDIEAVFGPWYPIRFLFMARKDKRKILLITSSGS